MSLEWWVQVVSIGSFVTSVISIILVFMIKKESKDIKFEIKSLVERNNNFKNNSGDNISIGTIINNGSENVIN